MLEPIIKQIENFPKYFVDIYGNVYRKWSDEMRRLKPEMDKDGYNCIVLCKDGKHYSRKNYILVLEAFVCSRPEGMVACHGIKGNSSDSLDNLSWGTWSKNNGEDKIRDGKLLNPDLLVGNSKLTKDQVLEIRRLKGINTSLELSIMFNISRVSIQKIWARNTWTHI